MAVTSCTLDRKTRKATVDELNIGVYTLRYEVITDSDMGPKGVANGALTASPHALPSQWQTYSYQGDTDALSFARDYDIEGDPDCLRRYWITVTFRAPEQGQGSQTVGGSPIKAEPNPLDREPVVWWDRTVTTIHAIHDKDGKPIVNKCKDLYPDDIELEKPKGIRVVEMNVATEGEVAYYQRTFDGAVNISGWSVGGYTIPARAALCQEVSAGPPQTEHGYVFFHLVFRFAFAEEGATWDYPLTEMGQFHWTKTDGVYDLIATTTRRKVTNAQKVIFLKEDGTPQDDDDDPIITKWRIRREVNFNDLPF